jgi:hypothetical protein
MTWTPDFPKLCDHRARCYVNGSAYHSRLKSIQPKSGCWSVHFRDHPRVIEAESEGWARELRTACIAECRRRLMAGQDTGTPDDLMPDRKAWWETTRKNAERYRASSEAVGRAS